MSSTLGPRQPKTPTESKTTQLYADGNLGAEEEDKDLPSVDEILASKLRPSPLATENTEQKTTAVFKKGNSKKQLERFKFEEKPKLRQTLHEAGQTDSSSFDQFKGRKTDFTMDFYSVKMPDHVSPQLQAHADQVERDITGHGCDTEENIINMVDADCELRREKRVVGGVSSSEEKLFGTAIQDDEKADYGQVFGPTKPNQEDKVPDAATRKTSI